MRILQIGLVGLFFFSVATASAQPYEEVSQDVRDVAVKTKLEGKQAVVALYAKGLCCPSCAIGVRKKVGALAFVDGARLNSGVELDAQHQLVTIAVKKGKQVDLPTLAKAIDDAGYAPVHFYSLVKGKVVTKPLVLPSATDMYLTPAKDSDS